MMGRAVPSLFVCVGYPPPPSIPRGVKYKFIFTITCGLTDSEDGWGKKNHPSRQSSRLTYVNTTVRIDIKIMIEIDRKNM